MRLVTKLRNRGKSSLTVNRRSNIASRMTDARAEVVAAGTADRKGPLSAQGHVDSQSAKRRFFVFTLHVGASLPHGLDHLVERDVVVAIT